MVKDQLKFKVEAENEHSNFVILFLNIRIYLNYYRFLSQKTAGVEQLLDCEAEEIKVMVY